MSRYEDIELLIIVQKKYKKFLLVAWCVPGSEVSLSVVFFNSWKNPLKVVPILKGLVLYF